MDTWQLVWTVLTLVVAIAIIVDVWRSPAGTGEKIVWTLAPIVCFLPALVVYLVWGRKHAHQGAAGGPRI